MGFNLERLSSVNKVIDIELGIVYDSDIFDENMNTEFDLDSCGTHVDEMDDEFFQGLSESDEDSIRNYYLGEDGLI